MLITLTIEEINGFPEEIKNYLFKYAANQLPADNKTTETEKTSFAGIPKPPSQVLEDQLIVWLEGTDDEDMSGFTTRHSRNLIAGNFDWERMIGVEISSLRHDFNNNVEISVNENSFEVKHWADETDFNDPKTWGFAIIFCAMFGFGGAIPNFKVARNSKELCKNLEKFGISGDKIIQPRSVGPLLKSITNLVVVWHAIELESPPYYNIHWFDFDKAGNFYFAGTTLNDCIEAAKNVTETYFIVE